MIDFIIYIAELKQDVKEQHEKRQKNGTMINELSVNGKHLKNLKMICTKVI
jgi:hypothetical protein